MAEQPQFADLEAPEADAAEQSADLVESESHDPEDFGVEPERAAEADPADTAEQAVDVPVDEDEYR